MKTTSIFKSILVASVLSITLHSCDKEDDPQGPVAEPLTLECQSLVPDGETLTLEDRGSGVDYIINCMAVVAGDLIIKPGVTIQFGETGGINVSQGSLQAIGTFDKQILFTGEDKVPGSWGYIVFQTDDVKNKMTYCTVEYAGGFAVSSNNDKGNVVVLHDSRLEMEDCTLRHSAEYGVKFTSHSTEIPKFINNTITGCKYPIHIAPNLVQNISGGDYTGNTIDAILVKTTSNGTNAAVNDNNTHEWAKHNVPYHVTKMIKVSGGTLIIQPGAILEFENGMGIEIGDSDASTLIAVGTASEPIIFSGIVKSPGAWLGLEFNFTNSPLNEVAFAKIEYAGSNNDAGIYMWAKPILNVHDVIFENIAGCGFVAKPSTTSFPNTNLTESNNTFNNVSGGPSC